MKIITKYNIWDEVETLLWDIWHIVEIIVQTERIRYTIWYNTDKFLDLSERQIVNKVNKKKKNMNK